MTNFNFTFQPGMSSEQIIGFEMAGRIWSQYIQDDTVFNIHVMMTDELPPAVAGGAIAAYVTTDIATIQKALEQDATSADDTVAIANLNTTVDSNGVTQYNALIDGTQHQSSELTITRANAKAVGFENLLPPNTTDGYVVFNSLKNSTYGWDYDFSRTSSSSSQQLDFLGMALHELGHTLGFTSSVDMMDAAPNPADQRQPSLFNFLNFGKQSNTASTPDLSQTSLLDLFRYSERSTDLNAQELTVGESAYFSIDGGQTPLAPLSTGFVNKNGVVKGYQASHWASQTPENAVKTPEFPSIFGFISNPLGSTFSLVSGILSLPGILLGQQVITPTALSQQQNSLGIMDDTVVLGSRSNISNLDLQALDVIGYDISNASASLDYATLLQDTQTALAQKIGVDINALSEALSTSSLVIDQQAALEDLLERRFSRLPTRAFAYFQEVDTPNSLNETQTTENQYAFLGDSFNTQLSFDTNSNDRGSNIIVETAPLDEGQNIQDIGSPSIPSKLSSVDSFETIEENQWFGSENNNVSVDVFTFREDPLLIPSIASDSSIETEGDGVLMARVTDAPFPLLNNTTHLIANNDLSRTSVAITPSEISTPMPTPQNTWVRPLSSNYQNVLGTSHRQGLLGRGLDNPLMGYGGSSNSLWGKGVANLFGLGNLQRSF